MSRILIHKNDRSKSNNDYPTKNKITNLTPKKNSITQHSQSSRIDSKSTADNELQRNKNESTIIPITDRMKRLSASSSTHNHIEHIHPSKQIYSNDTNKIDDHKDTIVIGDFILKKKPIADRSIYNYKPKHTQTLYTYNGILDDNSKIRERTSNGITSSILKRNNTSSLESTYKNMTDLNRNSIDNQNHLSIDNNKYPIMVMPSSNIVQSSLRTSHSLMEKENLIDSLYSMDNISEQQNNSYHFDQELKYFPKYNKNNSSDNEEIICVAFGHDSKSRQMNSRPKNQQLTTKQSYSTLLSSTNNNDVEHILLQEVVDVGTSIDHSFIKQMSINTITNDPTSDIQATSLNNRQSLITTQSSRTESQTYRVNSQTKIQNHYEEARVAPSLTSERRTTISSSNTSTIHPTITPPEPNDYIDIIERADDQSSDNTLSESANNSEQSSSIEPVHRNNSSVHELPSQYDNIIHDDDEIEPDYIPPKPNRTYQTHRRGFFSRLCQGGKKAKSKKKRHKRKQTRK